MRMLYIEKNREGNLVAKAYSLMRQDRIGGSHNREQEKEPLIRYSRYSKFKIVWCHGNRVEIFQRAVSKACEKSGNTRQRRAQ